MHVAHCTLKSSLWANISILEAPWCQACICQRSNGLLVDTCNVPYSAFSLGKTKQYLCIMTGPAPQPYLYPSLYRLELCQPRLGLKAYESHPTLQPAYRGTHPTIPAKSTFSRPCNHCGSHAQTQHTDTFGSIRRDPAQRSMSVIANTTQKGINIPQHIVVIIYD